MIMKLWLLCANERCGWAQVSKLVCLGTRVHRSSRRRAGMPGYGGDDWPVRSGAAKWEELSLFSLIFTHVAPRPSASDPLAHSMRRGRHALDDLGEFLMRTIGHLP